MTSSVDILREVLTFFGNCIVTGRLLVVIGLKWPQILRRIVRFGERVHERQAFVANFQ